jgi:hypothetical protein
MPGPSQIKVYARKKSKNKLYHTKVCCHTAQNILSLSVRGGKQKFPESFKENYLKYLYRHETSDPFKELLL